RPWRPGSWGAPARRSSTPSPTPSLTAGRCALTARPRTPARGSPGPPATRPARRSRWPCLPGRGRRGTPRPLPRPPRGSRAPPPRRQSLPLPPPPASYVMENALFKISSPAEFHAQTAVEAAVALHPQVRGRLEEVETVLIDTQESAVRIIDKAGPLKN